MCYVLYPFYETKFCGVSSHVFVGTKKVADHWSDLRYYFDIHLRELSETMETSLGRV